MTWQAPSSGPPPGRSAVVGCCRCRSVGQGTAAPSWPVRPSPSTARPAESGAGVRVVFTSSSLESVAADAKEGYAGARPSMDRLPRVTGPSSGGRPQCGTSLDSLRGQGDGPAVTGRHRDRDDFGGSRRGRASVGLPVRADLEPGPVLLALHRRGRHRRGPRVAADPFLDRGAVRGGVARPAGGVRCPPERVCAHPSCG